jgi:hypothetical protein
MSSMNFGPKGRATGYSDYYKQTSKTPGASISIDIGPSGANSDNEDDNQDVGRESAIKRRLRLMKKARSS